MKKIETPVHKWAVSQLLPIFTPTKLDKINLSEFKSLNPDLAVLFAYGKLIPNSWLDVPLFGFINIHASLLPRWRGAAPVQRAIENGDKSTGITIMKMNDALDEGPIIATQKIEITNKMDGKSLIEKISQDSCSLLYNSLEKYLSGKISLKNQDNSLIRYANKIDKSETKIDWGMSNEQLSLKIRAFYPYPSMWFNYNGIRFKILRASLSNDEGDPGEILQKPLTIACKTGSLKILEIQQEGKKPMSIEQFILGFNDFKIGNVLSDG